MANGKNGVTMIRLLMAAGGILVAIASAFTIVQVKAANNTKNLETLKQDGTKPAQENTVKVAVIEKSLETVQEDVKEIKGDMKEFRTEQTAYHTELMKAIREK